jgi:hypothetical protein
VAGAGINYAYPRYYQDLAQVHFGLRKLAIEADVAPQELNVRLAAKMKLLAQT